jgi:hypothetical protein
MAYSVCLRELLRCLWLCLPQDAFSQLHDEALSFKLLNAQPVNYSISRSQCQPGRSREARTEDPRHTSTQYPVGTYRLPLKNGADPDRCSPGSVTQERPLQQGRHQGVLARWLARANMAAEFAAFKQAEDLQIEQQMVAQLPLAKRRLLPADFVPVELLLIQRGSCVELLLIRIEMARRSNCAPWEVLQDRDRWWRAGKRAVCAHSHLESGGGAHMFLRTRGARD